MKNLPQMLKNSNDKYGNKAMYGYKVDNEYKKITFSEFYQNVLRLSAGLIDFGLKKGDKVFIFADNRIEWITLDFALQIAGVVSIPRGTDTVFDEMDYIINHSGANYLIVENEKAFQKIGEIKSGVKVISIDIIKGIETNYTALLKKGELVYDNKKNEIERQIDEIKQDDIVTIIYTSGTTGNPKGVMLSHKNIITDIIHSAKKLEICKDDDFISMLPIWHIFQRTCEYITIYSGSTTYYSNLKNFTKDLKIVRPTMLALVPRILEGFYEKVTFNVERSLLPKKIVFNSFFFLGKTYLRAKSYLLNKVPVYKRRNFFKIIFSFFTVIFLFIFAVISKIIFKPIRDIVGGRNRIAVSGGGALPKHVDEFFNVIGIVLLDGYGLTETSPIVAVRSPRRVIINTIGVPIDTITVKIVNEKGDEVAPGEKGELTVKGDIVMQGYYNNADATNKVLKNGWFYTGDLATKTRKGEIQILGRIKDTIVLSGGENVEPEIVEGYINRSEFISNSVGLGHNKKRLSALIAPNIEKLTEFAEKNSIKFSNIEELILKVEIINLYKKEIITQSDKLKDYEKIFEFRILPNQFEVGSEITQTLKLKRHIIAEKYKSIIEEIQK